MKKNEQLNRIAIVLVELGLSNKDLATLIKKDPSTVSRWCTNETQPSVKILFVIARKLNTPVRELLVPNELSSASASKK